MNLRIKKVRRTLDLTQQIFAERIGMKQNSIALIESGKRNISDQAILSICREFDVREEWLRTGEGEMFNPAPTDVLDQLAYKYRISNADYVIIEKFLSLRPEIRKGMFDYFHEIDAALAEMEPYAPAYTGTEPPRSMDSFIKNIKNISKKVSESEPSTEELEEAYIKSRSNSARKTNLSASNSTGEENGKAVNR